MQHLLENYTMDEIIKECDADTIIWIQNHVLETIIAIKNGRHEKFNELVKFKDIRKFVNGSANAVVNKTNYKISYEDAQTEIRLELFYYLWKYYEIQNQPNELKTMVFIIKKWIVNKVISRVLTESKPQVFNDCIVTQVNDSVYRSILWSEIKNNLSSLELAIFELYFEENLSVSKIAKTLKKSRTTIYKYIDAITEKCGNFLRGEGL